jgi:hypothetical protein
MRLLALSFLAVSLAVASPAWASTDVVRPRTLTILVGKHGVSGGPKTLTVRKGAHVVIRVRSSIGKAVHLHGYDIERPIKNGTTFVRIAFVARVTGVFEIELHLTESRGLRIGLLTVK